MKSNRISALNELLMEKLSQVFLYQKSNCSVLQSAHSLLILHCQRINDDVIGFACIEDLLAVFIRKTQGNERN